ncbi:hypothetical protein [Mycolicibacterium sp.]|uniref:hypothetical protein n=1 Tax=Mycolicibacterium sp. TaxID=2320850 RepID=UPI001D30DDEB|nr:hypothetical protein [Mycolicibacterium sp.]MCB1263922.1 hypothetical protein [Mycobacterium sp.]MCB1291146.1 hypothetical protein [Mycobacterium sp.]MCB9408451.1 hypothetical protein [Mycolicibacterium sp.]
MAGNWPESARPLLEEFKRRATEALKPVVDEAARRVTAELMLRDATETAQLAWDVQEAITAEFRSHLSADIPRGANIDPAMAAMATAAVDVFLEYLHRIPVPPTGDDTGTATGPDTPAAE